MCRLSATLALAITLTDFCQPFDILNATLEFVAPKGLKISIPVTDPEVSLVAFHVNVNEEFVGVEHGQWAADIHKKQKGRWSYNIKDLRVKQGDTVYYWVYAIKNGLGYQALGQSYRVTEDDLQVSGLSESVKSSSTSAPCHCALPTTATTEASSEATTSKPMTGPTSRTPSVSHSQECELSLSSVRQGSDVNRPCAGADVFSAVFRTAIDLDKWEHEMHVGGHLPEDEFTVFTRDEGVASVRNHLVMRPTLLEHKYYKGFVSNGSLTMDPCSSADPQFCQASGTESQMLPPVLSARISTRSRFSFCYGTVQIKAKLPKGDWIVPELWLMPVNETQSGRIIMALSRGNSQLRVESESIASDVLEAGVVFNSARVTFDHTLDVSWANDYHVFKLVWKPNIMEFYVDNHKYAKWDPGKARPPLFDTEFYVSLGVHVGGLRDFPDRAVSGNQPKPWTNTDPMAKTTFWQARDSWLPSWNEDSALIVDYVTVTAL